MPGSVAEFWWMLDNLVGGMLPWLLLVLVLAGVAILFHGKNAARWVFPILLIVAGAWVARRWFWDRV